MNKQVHTAIHNKFDFVVTDAKTGEVRRSATSYNIVLDSCFKRLVNGQRFLYYIGVGSGTGTLDPTRTTMFNRLSSKSATFDSIDYSADTPWSRWYIRYQPEELVDSTITEVGLFYDSGASSIVTHSMLKDGEGNTIALTKRDDEVLTVYATIFAKIQPGEGQFFYGPPPGKGSPTFTNNYLLRYLLQRDVNNVSFSNVSIYSYGSNVAFEDDERYSCADYSPVYTAYNKSTTATPDVASRTVTTGAGRLAVADLNLPIKSIICPYAGVGFSVPSNIYPATAMTNIALTPLDDTYQSFGVPAYSLDMGTLAVKVNGASVPFKVRTYPNLHADAFNIGQMSDTLHSSGPRYAARSSADDFIYFTLNTSYSSQKYNQYLYKFNTHTKELIKLYTFYGTYAYMYGAVDGVVYFYGDVDGVFSTYRFDETTGDVIDVLEGSTEYESLAYVVSADVVGLYKSATNTIEFYSFSSGTKTFHSSIVLSDSGEWHVAGYQNSSRYVFNYYFHQASQTLFIYCSKRSGYSSIPYYRAYKLSGNTWELVIDQPCVLFSSANFVPSPSGNIMYIFYEKSDSTGYYLQFASFEYDGSTWTFRGEVDGLANGFKLPDHDDKYYVAGDNEIFMHNLGSALLKLEEDGEWHYYANTRVTNDINLHYNRSSSSRDYSTYSARELVPFTYDGQLQFFSLLCYYAYTSSGPNYDHPAGYCIIKRVEDYSVDVILDTPVTATDAVTADFVTNVINKTENNVLDVSYTITFGEGS